MPDVEIQNLFLKILSKAVKILIHFLFHLNKLLLICEGASQLA